MAAYLSTLKVNLMPMTSGTDGVWRGVAASRRMLLTAGYLREPSRLWGNILLWMNRSSWVALHQWRRGAPLEWVMARSSMAALRHLVMARSSTAALRHLGSFWLEAKGRRVSSPALSSVGALSLALSSVGALSLFREPASRWAAAGRTLGFDRTEGDVEGAAGGAANMELVQHAAPTLELGAVLVLLAKGSTARPGLRRPRRGDGRRALLVKGSTAYPGPRRPRRGDGRRGRDHGPGLDHGRRPHHLGGPTT